MDREHMATLLKVAERVFMSGVCPPDHKNMDQTFAVMLAGAELGLGPMQSIRSIQIVKGKLANTADFSIALCVRSPVCEYFRLVSGDDKKAIYETRRRAAPAATTLSYSIEQAQRAGLAGNGTWKAHPEAMLRARCAAALARAVYPDLVAGIYTNDEADEIRGESRADERQEDASHPHAEKEIEEAEKPTGSKAFATFVDRVVVAVGAVALMVLRRLLVNGVRDEGQEPGEYLADGDGGELGADSMIVARLHQLGHRLTRADHTYLLTAEDDKVASLLDGQAGALAGKVGIELKETIVGWWLAHRGEVKGDAVASKLLYYALVRRWDGSDDEDPSGARTKKARAQLDAAVKTASEPVANDAPAQAQARKVREVLPGDEEQIRAHVARYEHPRAIENAARKYAPMPALHRILAARLMAVSEPDDRGIRLSDIGALLLIERWGREGKIERYDAKPATRVA